MRDRRVRSTPKIPSPHRKKYLARGGGDSGSLARPSRDHWVNLYLTKTALGRLHLWREKTIQTELGRLYAELLDFYRDRLWPTPQDAEDFVQRAFEKALKRSGVQDIRALVFHIAKDLLKDEYRARERRPEVVSWEQLIGDGDRLDHLTQFQTLDFEDADFASDFDEAVRGLDDDPRDAFILGELRGLTTREAGIVLDTSHETTRVRRDAATTHIRKELLR